MLYMFTKVFGNFHLIGGYFIISSSIPSRQPNSLHPLKSILLNNKYFQISSTKQILKVKVKWKTSE